MGSRVSRSTSRTSKVVDISESWIVTRLGRKSAAWRLLLPRSVISANVKLALRWRSIFSENTRVLSALKGSPEKKSVSPR
jgi:hypothetical protein